MWNRVALIALCLLLLLAPASAVASGEANKYVGTWEGTNKQDGFSTQSTLTLNADRTALWIVSIPSHSMELIRESATWRLEGDLIVVRFQGGSSGRIDLVIGDDELILLEPDESGEPAASVVHTRVAQDDAQAQSASSPPEDVSPLPELPAAWQLASEDGFESVTLVIDDAGVIVMSAASDGNGFCYCGDYTIDGDIIIVLPGSYYTEAQLRLVDGCLTDAEGYMDPFTPVELPEWYSDMTEAQTVLPEDMLGTWVSQQDGGIAVTFGADGSIVTENYEETIAVGHIIRRGPYITGFSNDAEYHEVVFTAKIIDGDVVNLDGMLSLIGNNAFTDDNHVALFEKGEKRARPAWEYELDGAGNAIITVCNEEFPDGVVTVPEALDGVPVVALSDRLFEGRGDITAVSLPESLTSIGGGTFRNCASLSHITLPASLTSIGADAFAGCASLAELDIPASVSGLGQWSLSGCASLASLTLPGTVDTIPIEMISGCQSLKEVFIEEGVTAITCGYSAKLPRDLAIYLPRSMESIDQLNAMNVKIYAYEDSQIYINHRRQFDPYGTNNASWNIRSEYDERQRVADTSGYTIMALDDSTCVILGYTGDDANLVIPDTIDQLKVTRIGESAFKGNQTIASLVIPEGVVVVEDSAFYRCDSLTSVVLPSTIEEVEASAFGYCKSLASFELNDGLRVVGEDAFHSADLGRSAQFGGLPRSIEVIGPGAFAGCTFTGETLTLHEGLKVVGSHAFYRSIVGDVVIESVDTQLEGAFWESYARSVTLAPGTTTLPYAIFFNCVCLREVFNMESVTVIGDFAFKGCDAMDNAPIPEGVTRIGESAFSNCTDFTSVVLPDSVQTIGRCAFDNCTELTEIALPEGITRIEDYTFNSCKALTTINLPSSVTYIGQSAFAYCEALSELTLSAGAQIDTSAFYGCDNLTVRIPDDAALIEWAQMSGVNFTTDSGVTEAPIESDPIDELVGTWVFDDFVLNSGKADVIAFTDDFRFQYGVAEGDFYNRTVTREGEGTFIYHDGNIIITIGDNNIVCQVIKDRTMAIHLWGLNYTQKGGYDMPDL